jgi:hypothetical protein
MLAFSTQLCELLPLFTVSAPPPPPFPVRTVCWGGLWGSRPQADQHLPQSSFTGQFFRYDILHCLYESYLSTRSKKETLLTALTVYNMNNVQYTEWQEHKGQLIKATSGQGTCSFPPANSTRDKDVPQRGSLNLI